MQRYVKAAHDRQHELVVGLRLSGLFRGKRKASALPGMPNALSGTFELRSDHLVGTVTVGSVSITSATVNKSPSLSSAKGICASREISIFCATSIKINGPRRSALIIPSIQRRKAHQPVPHETSARSQRKRFAKPRPISGFLNEMATVSARPGCCGSCAQPSRKHWT
jgi:hypothetical protein